MACAIGEVGLNRTDDPPGRREATAVVLRLAQWEDDLDAKSHRVLAFDPTPARTARARRAAILSNGAPSERTLDFDPLSAALCRIARIVSDTFELKDVFTKVAAAAGDVLPFEAMGVCRLEKQNQLRLYAVVGSHGEDDPSEVVRTKDFSPALRIQPGTIHRIGDAATELDAGYPMDRWILEGGVRSLVCAPLMSGGPLAGEV